MESTETTESPTTSTTVVSAPAAAACRGSVGVVVPQACPTCGAAPAANAAGEMSYIYAIGRIEPRSPRASIEKEFAQATGRTETVKMTDRQVFHKVLSDRQNRYLVKQLCWVMTIRGLETYIVIPRDPLDFDLLVESLRPEPSPLDLDVVIGMKGPLARPEMCNGLTVPLVALDQLYSFDRHTLIQAIRKDEKASTKESAAAAEEVLDRIMQMTDNAGATDEHRALNYLAVRYQAIYAKAAQEFAANASLSAVEVRRSPLSGTRNIVNVIFSYTNRITDVTEKFSVRVDVTEEFPFLMTKMSPYYDR